MTETISRDQFEEYLRQVLPRIDSIPATVQSDILAAIDRLRHLEKVELARKNFRAFVELVKPDFKFSSRGQHDDIAQCFEDMAFGDLKRASISLPPRFGKSTLGSVLFPAWFMGLFPSCKVMQCSASADLSKTFSMQLRSVMESPAYQEIFPAITFNKNSRAVQNFTLEIYGGSYTSVGAGAKLAGRGGDLVIVDDVVTEQDVLHGNGSNLDVLWDWLKQGPLQRLQPGGRILQIATRWSKVDPVGRSISECKSNPTVPQYRVINFPALDEFSLSTFKELWTTEELVAKRAIMPPVMWAAQYQQNPITSETSIVPISLWRAWDRTNHEGDYSVPGCFNTIMVFDTAFTANKRSNPTACTVWGIFEDEDGANNIILMHSFKKIMDYTDLKKEATRLIKEWSPDTVYVEAINSGETLRQEMRRSGITMLPVRPLNNKEDKYARLHSVAGIFHSGLVWYIPNTENFETLTQVNDFPAGDGDDLVDTVSYALRQFRKGGFIYIREDIKEEEEDAPYEAPEFY